jgi:mannan endo-1,4-beta-mannosidase
VVTTDQNYIPKGNNVIQLGYYDSNSPGSFNNIEEMISMTGFTPDLVSWYTGNAFSEPWNKAFADEAASVGADVLLQWQPRGIELSSIMSGAQDKVIAAMIAGIKSSPRQVWLSFGQEMNGNWYSWAAKAAVSPANRAQLYVEAYRYIWNKFQAAGVINVTWVWGPNISYGGSEPLKNVYPGDAFVDVVGFDGYFQYPTSTFDSVFVPSISELRQFTGKPLMIAETGVAGAAAPAQLASIFQGCSLYGIIAIVYFNVAQDGSDSTHQDWDLRKNLPAMSAFKNLAIQHKVKPLVFKG